jgi:hypothetical protein
MYFPRNWEFGWALSKLRNFGGGFEPPPPPLYATACHHGLRPGVQISMISHFSSLCNGGPMSPFLAAWYFTTAWMSLNLSVLRTNCVHLLLQLLMLPKNGFGFKSLTNVLISFVVTQRVLRGFPQKFQLCCCSSRFVLFNVCQSFTAV